MAVAERTRTPMQKVTCPQCRNTIKVDAATAETIQLPAECPTCSPGGVIQPDPTRVVDPARDVPRLEARMDAIEARQRAIDSNIKDLLAAVLQQPDTAIAERKRDLVAPEPVPSEAELRGGGPR